MFKACTLKRTRILMLCAVLLTLNGCTIRIAYGFLDNLLSWQAAKYVKFVGPQKSRSKEIFKDFHRWHRKTQLTLYVEFLSKLKAGILEGDISGEYMRSQSHQLQDLIDLSIDRLIPGAAELISSLTDEQVEEMLENMRKEREKYKKQYAESTPEKIQKQRIKDVTRFISGFFGRFTAEQKQRLIDWEQTITPYDDLLSNQQALLQQEFAEAMTFRDDIPRLIEALRPLAIVRTDEWDPELERILRVNQELTHTMLADLFNSQTPKQRKKLTSKFDRYIKDLDFLARKAK